MRKIIVLFIVLLSIVLLSIGGFATDNVLINRLVYQIASTLHGKINSALTFNGNTSGVVTPKIPLTNTFSISAWVNPSVMAQKSYARIANTVYSTGMSLGTDYNGTKYKFIVNGGIGSNNSCGAGIAYGCAQGGTVIPGWHLITGTYDGVIAKLYVDNALVASDTVKPPLNTSLALYIGQLYSGGANARWNGGIDEVRLYNRALTPNEVTSIYNYVGVVPDTIPPTLSTGQVTFSVSVADNTGIASVQFQVDGVNLGVPVIVPPYVILLDTTQIPNGNHNIIAIAKDLANNSTSALLGTIFVDNKPSPVAPLPPVQELVGYWKFDEGLGLVAHDSSGNNYNGTITDGTWLISGNSVVVQFFVDGNPVGPLLIAEPYTIIWDSTKVPNGSHTITVKATNSAGQFSLSKPVVINVLNTPGGTGAHI